MKLLFQHFLSLRLNKSKAKIFSTPDKPATPKTDSLPTAFSFSFLITRQPEREAAAGFNAKALPRACKLCGCSAPSENPSYTIFFGVNQIPRVYSLVFPGSNYCQGKNESSCYTCRGVQMGGVVAPQ